MEGQGPNQCAQAKDEEDVDQIGAGYVGHCQGTAPLQPGGDSHSQLGHAGADGDDGEADQQRIYPQQCCQARCSSHYQLRPHDESEKACEKYHHLVHG